MKTLLGLLVLLAAAIVLALLLGVHTHGYVAVRVGHTLVEAGLPMAVLLWLAAGALLLLLWSLLTSLLRGGSWLVDVGGERRRRLARVQLVRGLVEFSEGRYARAERRLARTARHAETPLVHYLMAARAAQLLGSDERRDRYLREAYETTPEAQLAVLLTQAEFQIARRRYEHALATLHRLEEIAPRDLQHRRLLARAYEQVGDHAALAALLPSLRRAHALDPAELARLERVAALGRLAAFGERPRTEDVLDLYERLSAPNRRHPEVVRAVVETLLAAGAGDRAAALLAEVLEHDWNEDLVRFYGDLGGTDPAARVLVAEGWLEAHDDSPGLHHALGVLHTRLGHHGKVRTHFERSLRLGFDARTALAYARLLELIGERDEARRVALRGLEEAVNAPSAGLPEAPPATSTADGVRAPV
jgi:HemY protein